MASNASKVLVVGATGHIGLRIALEVSKSGIQTSALIRQNPAKTEKRDANLKKLQEAGISLVEADLADEERLIAVLKKSDVVVSALSGSAETLESDQLKLIEASKKAGTIKRFFPSEFGGDYTPSGADGLSFNPALRQYLQAKENIQRALKFSGLPYTIVINYAFMEFFLPNLGQFGPPSEPDAVAIYAGGGNKAYTTSEIDVGRVIARSLDDPRTVNKKVVVKANAFTQHELVAVWERVSGKRKKLIDVSAEEYENKNKGNQGKAAVFAGLFKSIWIDALYDRPVENGVLATELYPDMHFTSVEEYYEGLLNK